jgi:carboxymethylenebutenolidase
MPEPSILSERVELKVSDGAAMAAYVARPRGQGPHAAMIVLQEAFGVNSHIRSIAERLARQGFVSIAPELFHRTGPGFEGDYANFQPALQHVRAVTTEGAEADLRAAFEWLAKAPEVTAEAIHVIGFCMGGRVCFLANSILPVKSAVSYSGGGIAPELLPRATALKAPMLFFLGRRGQAHPARAAPRRRGCAECRRQIVYQR